MDSSLAARLNALTKQNETLRDARLAYLLKEASRKSFESRLVRAADGKSHAEKTVNAQSTLEWEAFQLELATLEADFDFQRLKYEVLDKAWTSEYGTYKIEESLIRKHKAV